MKSEGYKETKWDSSMFTMERIHHLISVAHRAALRDYEVSDYQNDYYKYTALKRLFVESRCKMVKKEKDELDRLFKQITETERKYKKHLFAPTIKRNNTLMKNSEHEEGWNKLNYQLEEYEFVLMEYMDNHNLLAGNAKTGIDRFRG